MLKYWKPAKTVPGVLPGNQRLLALLSGVSEPHSLFNPEGDFNLSPHATAELPQQLDASLNTALSCKTRESSLGFIVPLLDFLWSASSVLLSTRFLKASQGLIFGSCKGNQALLICTFVISPFGLSQAEEERFLKRVQKHGWPGSMRPAVTSRCPQTR